MSAFPGRRVPLSLPRRWITDLMHASRHVPVAAADRRLLLPDLVAARDRAPDPPPWAALFVKAYAIVAARHPALRRAYVPFPWPHLYESDISVASVAVAREYAGEPAVFFGLLHAPESQPLTQITGHLRGWKTEPVEQVRPFARLIRYTRYPLPVRRLLWWVGLNRCGRQRAKGFGTFGVTALGGAGAALLKVVSPLATTLNYGPVGPDGGVEVRVFFDHRVLDGMTVAAALADLEAVLNDEMVREVAGRAAVADAA